MTIKPDWNASGLIVRSPIAKSAAIIPILGYLLIYAGDINAFVENIFQAHGDSLIDGEWKIYLIYWGSVFLTAGVIIFYMAAPTPVRRFRYRADYAFEHATAYSISSIASLFTAILYKYPRLPLLKQNGQLRQKTRPLTHEDCDLIQGALSHAKLWRFIEDRNKKMIRFLIDTEVQKALVSIKTRDEFKSLLDKHNMSKDDLIDVQATKLFISIITERIHKPEDIAIETEYCKRANELMNEHFSKHPIASRYFDINRSIQKYAAETFFSHYFERVELFLGKKWPSSSTKQIAISFFNTQLAQRPMRALLCFILTYVGTSMIILPSLVTMQRIGVMTADKLRPLFNEIMTLLPV